MKNKIYGVDLYKDKLTPNDVLKAMIKCCDENQKKCVAYLKRNGDKNYQYLSHFDGKVTANLAFKKMHADINNPSKKDLEKFYEFLINFSSKISSHNVIEKHFNDFKCMISQLNQQNQ